MKNHVCPTCRRPITAFRIRGVDYHSAREVAEKFGVALHSVYAARKQGTLDTLGLGRGNHAKTSKPVTIRGVEYPTITAAAEAYSINKAALGHMIAAGIDLDAALPPLKPAYEWSRLTRAVAP